MLVLASGSPRRAQILSELRIPFLVDVSGIDETIVSGESAEAAAERLAAAKASDVALRHPSSWVLAADTLVDLAGEILGKPRSDAEAGSMLRRLSGREHRVVTAVRLLRGEDPGRGEVAWSAVRFAPLTEEEIAWYVRTGEPADKAGAYAIQGLGARFVESIDGSFTNVMGLPARAVYRLMTGAGDPFLATLALSSP
ncbi:MAG: Maf family protein [Acidobacteriota bacterium]